MALRIKTSSCKMPDKKYYPPDKSGSLHGITEFSGTVKAMHGVGKESRYAVMISEEHLNTG